ncbi:MAG TPA: ATP-binding protein, partial [Dehalococcoidia bacterium]|nr:ATP-binding protein [Dehalococcoidia bacterium]
VPLASPGSAAVAGYVGVEVPLSLFAAGTAQDEGTIIELTITAVVAAALLVLLFVDRFVRRPVAQLERGVARIAAGDYTHDVDVRSDDELGRLAAGVNRMRARIAEYVGHVDGSLARLQAVSRALTTTTGGVQQLEAAVLRAAAATAGAGASVTLLRREGAALVAVRGTADTALLDARAAAELVAGHPVRRSGPGGQVLAVPSFLQGAVAGALLVVASTPVSESDERALQVLGNNGAVALQNAALFEQQSLAVERLRELNRLKTDFLSTTQHELRTPVLAIRSQLELLAAAWDHWDESAKRDALRDIEVSTTLLGEVVETIVEFSLLNGDAVDLHVAGVPLHDAVHGAVDDIGRHFRDGIPVEMVIAVPSSITVRADAARLREVLRAVIDNAVKFTPGDGRVVVRARADEAAGCCHVEVIDTGTGIAADALPRVFDRFYQQDNSRTRRVGGMGLGLTLARHLCEAHGATIEIASQEGSGTTVRLCWPLADHPAEAPTSGLIRFGSRTPVTA